ncbi:Gfo/Idh/MocA family protein [Paenibacillus yanchengensis]|uniref:Gfo/Idh/MocA family protein n=1 Tax=Paenibacillus yanchengensis TaxID=2035833 RepID=A0ABW4YPE8_9BACL
MMSQQYRMGVVGLGEGRSIMSAALQSKQWELVQVCDLNEQLCREREQEFSFNNWTTSYEAMLANENIDVIAIYTPDQLHFTHIKQAVLAGKHVICTKPVLHSLEQASELLALMAQTDRKLFIGQSSRFFEPMLHQRRDFEAGNHGELAVVETQYITDGRWFLEKGWSKQAGFSWMYNFMIHAVDLVKWYLPDVTEVMGFARTSENSLEHNLEVWDSLRFLMRNEQGQIAQISGDYTLPTLDLAVEPSIACVLRGSKGTSRAEYSNLLYHTKFTGQPAQTTSFEEKQDYYFRFGGTSHHAGEYQNYIEYFADCLDAARDPLPDANEAIHTLAIMEAMTRSVQLGGQPVKISTILAEYNLTEKQQ